MVQSLWSAVPGGSFTLHKDPSRPAVFLAGGIGIAPIRSILQHAAQDRLEHKLYLFYSNRATDDAAFLEELENLGAQNRNFSSFRQSLVTEPWRGGMKKATSIMKC